MRLEEYLMAEARQLTEAEKSKGYKSIVYVRPAPPTLGKGSLQQIDPETNQPTGKTYASWETAQYGPGGRRGTGYLFVTLPPTPKVAEDIRKREEKQEEKELAKKEAEYEAKRIESGKVKAEDVVLQRKGSSKLLAERLKSMKPSKAELEEEKRRRIAGTLAKQVGLQTGITLSEKIEKKKEEERLKKGEIKPISPLEAFSEQARTKLDLSETKEGLLEIGKGERKIVVERRHKDKIISLEDKPFLSVSERLFPKTKRITRGEIVADIPKSAEYQTGFSSQIGTGIFDKSLFSKIDTSLKNVTTKLVPISFFEISRAVTESKIEKLREEGKIKTFKGRSLQLKSGLLGIPSGLFIQVREHPLQSVALFSAGTAFGSAIGYSHITLHPYISPVSKIAIGSLTAFQAGKKVKEEDYGGAGEVIGRRAVQTSLFLGGAGLGKSFSAVGDIDKVEVTKIEGNVGEYQERIDIESSKATDIQKLKFPVKEEIRLLKTEVSEYSRIISSQDPYKTVDYLSDESVRFDFRLTDQGVKEVLVKNIPATTRYFKPPSADSFKISVDGKMEIRSFDILIQKDVVGMEKTVDLSKFSISKSEGFAELSKVEVGESGYPGLRLKAGIGGKATITETLKRVMPDIFGIGLLVTPEPILTTSPTSIPKGAILSIKAVVPQQDYIFPFVTDIFRRDRSSFSETRSRRASIPKSRISPISEAIKDFNIDMSESRFDFGSPQDVVIDVKPSLIDKRSTATATGLDFDSAIKDITEQDQRQIAKPIIDLPLEEMPQDSGGGLFFKPMLYMGQKKRKKGKKLKQRFAYTPDFISSVLNEFGKMPKKRIFTGQERRYKLKGKRFISKLPKSKGSYNNDIFKGKKPTFNFNIGSNNKVFNEGPILKKNPAFFGKMLPPLG